MADTTGSTQRTRTKGGRRSRVRRAGESAYGLLLLTRQLLLAAVVLLALAAGIRASWTAADRAAVHDGRGTLTVTRCTSDACTGPFRPEAAGGEPRDHVVLRQTAGTEEGDKIPVVLRHGSPDEVVRTGTAGMFRACLPLGGALILSAVVLAGGLRLRRTAWTTALLGVAVLTGAFLTM